MHWRMGAASPLLAIAILALTAAPASSILIEFAGANVQVIQNYVGPGIEDPPNGTVLTGTLPGCPPAGDGAVREWRDSDSGGAPHWAPTGFVQGSADQAWLRDATASITTTTTVPSEVVTFHLEGDSNDGRVELYVDALLVARLDMFDAGNNRIIVVVRSLAAALHTLVIDDIGVSGPGSGDDVASFGGAVLGCAGGPTPTPTPSPTPTPTASPSPSPSPTPTPTPSPTPTATMEMTFSVDFQGPTVFGGALDSFFGVAITDGDILTPAPPGPPGPNLPLLGPLPPPGIEIGSLPGAVGVVPGGLGILPGMILTEVDALSYGRDGGDTLYFSVDEFAAGVPTVPLDVFSEGVLGASEASADVFVYLGPVVAGPPGPSLGNTLAVDGDGVAPGVPGVGLIEPNPPTVGVIPDVGDNLDAVDLGTTFSDLTGPVFFSLDIDFLDSLEGFPVNSDTAAANGFSAADVLVSVAGGAPTVAIPAAALGLDLVLGFNTDDLDALAFDDADGSLSLTPGDLILFSVRRDSVVVSFPDSLFGLPIEPSDVLTVPAFPGGFPSIFIAAESLGLATFRDGTAGPFGYDELDALDVKLVPEPGWIAQLVPGLALLAWLGRRRRRGTARSPRSG
jgi:hypothetical protein